MNAPGDVHPHDLALLYDLVDGRLAPRARDELERRLVDEPDLRAVHAGILLLRRRLAALPTPALPSDFLERVRAKAGFPPAPTVAVASPRAASPVVGAAQTGASAETAVSAGTGASANGTNGGPAADSSRADPASGDDRVVTVPPAARLLVFSRFAYAAAAVIVVGLGAFVYLADRDAASPSTTQTAGKEARELDDRDQTTHEAVDDAKKLDRSLAAAGPLEAGGSLEKGGSADPRAPAGGAPPSAASGSPRPFGPGGAVAPGLRDGSGSAERPAGARGGSRAPAAPPAAPTAAAPTAAAPAASEPLDARPDALGGGGGGVGAARRSGPPGTKPGTSRDARPAPPSVPAEAFDGADRVFVVYADSLDVARAEVSLLVADARANRMPDATRVGDAEPSKAKGSAKDVPVLAPADATKGRAPVPPPPAVAPPRDDDAPPAAAPPPDVVEGSTFLGSFFVELDDAALARLAGAIGPRGVADELARKTPDAEAEAAAPPSAPEPTSGPDRPLAPDRPPIPDSAPVPAPVPSPAATPSDPPAAPVPEGGPPDGAATGSPPAGADEPAMAGSDRADGDARRRAGLASGGEVRRVRIVVLPRR